MCNSIANGDKFSRLSIGIIRLDDIRHVIEQKPEPKPEKKQETKPTLSIPAIPLMDEEDLREVMRIHYADQPREVVEEWLQSLDQTELQSAAEWAALHPM